MCVGGGGRGRIDGAGGNGNPISYLSVGLHFDTLNVQADVDIHWDACKRNMPRLLVLDESCFCHSQILVFSINQHVDLSHHPVWIIDTWPSFARREIAVFFPCFLVNMEFNTFAQYKRTLTEKKNRIDCSREKSS